MQFFLLLFFYPLNSMLIIVHASYTSPIGFSNAHEIDNSSIKLISGVHLQPHIPLAINEWTACLGQIWIALYTEIHRKYEIFCDVLHRNTSFFNSAYYASSWVAVVILTANRERVCSSKKLFLLSQYYQPFIHIPVSAFIFFITLQKFNLYTILHDWLYLPCFFVSFKTNLFVPCALRCVISLNACWKQIFRSRLL